MSIKKINGYKINMDAVLGHGAYGSVHRMLSRFIRESRTTANYNVPSRS